MRSSVLTLGMIWKFVESRDIKWFVGATLSAVFSVQCLYRSAFYIAAFDLAGCAVCLWNRQRKTALLCLAVGVIAALSLPPHVPNIQKGEQWRDIARGPVSMHLIVEALNELLSAAQPLMQPIYIAAFIATIAIGIFFAVRLKARAVVYAIIVFLLATIFQITLLSRLGLPPRPWYFPLWLAPT